MEQNLTEKLAVVRIKEAFEALQYLAWRSEIGNKKAQEIFNRFHNADFGSFSGAFIQIEEAIEFIENIHCKNEKTMEITEETKIKDLIPEGYELESEILKDVNLGVFGAYINIPVKKKEVKVLASAVRSQVTDENKVK